MRILHEGNFNTAKAYELDGKYFADDRELPQQCCLTCKFCSMYNDTQTQCEFAKFGDNGKIICRNNIEDDLELFLESGLTEIEYQKESHWELYEGETIKGY